MSGSVVGGSALGAVDIFDAMRRIGRFHSVTLSVMLDVRDGARPVPVVTVLAYENDPLEAVRGKSLDWGGRMWHVTAESSPHDPEKWFSYLYGRLLEMDSLLSKERWTQQALPD